MVAGIGNVFLGDDGFGVEVVNRLLAQGGFPNGVRVEDYGIRGLHLAYELMEGYDTAILIDAIPRGEEPGTLFVLKPDMSDERLDRGELVQAGESPLIDSHGMDPMSVFSLLKTLGGSVEKVLIVGCEPADVSEQMGLSEPVAGAVEAAVRTVRELLQEASEMVSSATGGDEGAGKEGMNV
jgi:hydrogenase maturation protease